MSKGFGNIMRQAQQLQKKMATLNEEMKDETVEGQAGQGQVTVSVSLGLEVKSVSIDKELVNPDDTAMLEDLVAVAINDAVAKAKSAREERMKGVTGGMSSMMPGLF